MGVVPALWAGPWMIEANLESEQGPVSRRTALAALGSLSFLSAARRPLPTVASGLSAIERRYDLKLGIAALDTRTGVHARHRSDERFALCSTFKWILAAAVLSRVERGELSVSRRVSYGRSDLIEHAPVALANVRRGWMTVDELCAAAVSESDNSAANLLLPLVGGPTGLTRFVRANGDRITRLDRNEPALNVHSPGDERDTTTPSAMLRTMRRLLLGDTLAPDSRRRLYAWLRASTRGPRRLRAGIPPGWTSGSKAGTGPGGAVNDIAIAWPPGRAPILIASYVAGGSAGFAEREEVHARAARLIADAWR